MQSPYLREERRRESCVENPNTDADEDANSSSPSSPGPTAKSDSLSKADSSSSSSRKGLSKHYKGRSQSFTALSDVKTLEDLAKPENPFNAKLRQRRESRDGRRFSGCNASRGGDVERNPGHRPPLRAQTLTAAHLSALLTRT